MINIIVLFTLALLLFPKPRIVIIEKLKLVYPAWEQEGNLIIKPYFMDMISVLKASDIVISRAGAMTVTEMARMKKPCIMIPSPYVAENHQYKNAKVLADANAVVLIEEKELGNISIAKKAEELLSDERVLKKMSANISKFAGEDACELIYREIKELVK